MQNNNEYITASPYASYLKYTDEKEKLAQEIKRVCRHRKFSLKQMDCGNILDVGSGSGVNAIFLANFFPGCNVLGIEPSKAQYEVALSSCITMQRNLFFRNIGIENFISEIKFNFILVSHVLQYIQNGLTVENIVKKVVGMLNSSGEAWFVQQTQTGFAQIIFHMQPFLRNTRFRQWKTAEDFWPEISALARNLGCVIREQQINSSINGINFANPSSEDKERLKFMLLLDGNYDDESNEFKEHLAMLNLNKRNGKINHPNKIIKLRRV